MFRFSRMHVAALLAVGATCLGGVAQAGETSRDRDRIEGLGTFETTRVEAKQAGIIAKPAIALRAGGMFSPRGAGLVGVDISMPGVGLGDNGKLRLDVDAIFKANFGGVNTIFPVTINQIWYAPNPTGVVRPYFGGGVGAVFGGGTKFDGKLILGADITPQLGAEANLHFTEGNTLFTGMVRLKF